MKLYVWHYQQWKQSIVISVVKDTIDIKDLFLKITYSINLYGVGLL